MDGPRWGDRVALRGQGVRRLVVDVEEGGRLVCSLPIVDRGRRVDHLLYAPASALVVLQRAR